MRYDAAFYKIEEETALRSARIVLPDLLIELDARSVIDVGCGTGGWAAVAKACGCKAIGIDGYTGRALIDVDVRDISHGVACSGADLAICLEVGEHLPADSAEPLVAGLAMARYVLFSAAIPGQGGVNHVNERWGSWWAEIFAQQGMEGSSDLRWRHWNDHDVANWYRQNMLLFATPADLKARGFRPGVIDVVHPDRMGNWP